jgi:hypothetical protein
MFSSYRPCTSYMFSSYRPCIYIFLVIVPARSCSRICTLLTCFRVVVDFPKRTYFANNFLEIRETILEEVNRFILEGRSPDHSNSQHNISLVFLRDLHHLLLQPTQRHISSSSSEPKDSPIERADCAYQYSKLYSHFQ